MPHTNQVKDPTSTTVNDRGLCVAADVHLVTSNVVKEKLECIYI